MTEATIRAAETVTAAHVRALKSADSVTFHLHDGRGRVSAWRRADSSPDGFEQRVDVACESAVVDYGRDRSHGREPAAYAGFASMGHPAYHSVLASVIRRIRPGATLTLTWVRDNDSESHRAAGFHNDELHLVIAPARGPRETYLLRAQCGPDNTARMVRLA